MFDGVMPTPFQYIQKPKLVRQDISMRVDKTVANTSLRRKVHHMSKLFILKKFGHVELVRKVELLKGKKGFRLKLGESVFLKLDTVIVIKVVNANNSYALFAKQEA